MDKHIADIWSSVKGHYTKRDSMYMEFLDKMLPEFNGGRILEIGPGTGEFAKMIIKNYNVEKYRVLDLEKNISDSVNYIKKENLGITLDYTFSQNYKDLFDEEFDLIVSNICIPETPKEYREDLLNNIIPNTKMSMIIGQLNGDWDDGSYEPWIRKLFTDNFGEVSSELTPYLNCYSLTGIKK